MLVGIKYKFPYLSVVLAIGRSEVTCGMRVGDALEVADTKCGFSTHSSSLLQVLRNNTAPTKQHTIQYMLPTYDIMKTILIPESLH